MSGGRTRITARALERVTAAVSGEAFGAPGDSVRVELTDDGGRLEVAVTTAIRSVSLARAIAEPRAVERSGGSLTERAAHAESVIAGRVHDLTGRTVDRVSVRLTTVHLRQEPRVR